MALNNYKYLEDLNPQQREAVEYMDGPSLVIAGAGAGKTRVITYKIVHLLNLGFEPYRIMALTFTNKAAKEMRERITAVVGDKVSSKLMMGTFHSIFLNILRRNVEKIGFKPGFTIYDTADSKNLIKMILKDFGLNEKEYKPSTVLNTISNAKNRLILPDQYLADQDLISQDKRSKRPMIGRIYEAYCERCKIANAMDFDDILVFMNILLRDNPDVLRHYQEFFRYILVDEYQDTNFAQHLIISQLSGERNRIFVVGDDAQSIYSFRGAQIDHIINMGHKIPNLKIFKLERNYRSTQNIIEAADSLIEKNDYRLKKKLYSEKEPGEKVEILSAFSEFEEAFLIANLINKSKLTNHDNYEEYAILYRTNAQSRALEESLRKRDIPYRIYGSLSFYQRKEVKDAIAYFRLAVNPDDDEALRRIINFPARGIGDTTLKKLSDASITAGKSIWSIITETDLKSIGLNSGTIKKLYTFKELIKEFIDDNEKGVTAYELGQLIFNRTGLLALYAYEATPESITRHENLTEILSGLKEFVDIRMQTGEGKPDMQSYLSEAMLATDQDNSENDDLPKVTMMTVHAAKGLEFSHVYIVGVEEDLFPSTLSQGSLKEIEEERRLLYVAITRAKTSCTITYATSRYKNGQPTITGPSRFIAEINPKYINMKASSNIGHNDYAGVNPYKNYISTSKSSPDYTSHYRPKVNNPIQRNFRKISEISKTDTVAQHSVSELEEGMKISHSKFGIGIIDSIDSISGEPSINVTFKEVGKKRLLLRFAKFDILK